MDADPAVSADLVLVALDAMAPRSEPDSESYWHPQHALPSSSPMPRDTGRDTAGRAVSFNSGKNVLLAQACHSSIFNCCDVTWLRGPSQACRLIIQQKRRMKLLHLDS
jgi:hypothetical protein